MGRGAYAHWAGRGARAGELKMIHCISRFTVLYPLAHMASKPISTGRLDRLAMGLSGLCAVHCVATAVLLGLVASAGGMLGKPIIHEVGLSLAMVLGAIALGRGMREHGFV